MKKIVATMLVTLFLGSLMGCQNHDVVSSAKAPEAAMQTFQGVIPCADCEGIQVSLLLQQGGYYRLQEHYLGADSLNVMQQGRWERTAEKLILVSDKGEKRYFRPLNDGLEMMDTEGNPIHSENNYRLTPVSS